MDDRTFIVHLRSILTPSLSGLAAERNPAPAEIIGRQFYSHTVTWKNLDVMHAHLPGYVRQNLMAIVQFNLKHGIRQGLYNGSFNFNGIFFCHTGFYLKSAKQILFYIRILFFFQYKLTLIELGSRGVFAAQN